MNKSLSAKSLERMHVNNSGYECLGTLKEVNESDTHMKADK